jgi:hypothetical protein
VASSENFVGAGRFCAANRAMPTASTWFGLGPLKLFFGKAPHAYQVEKGYGEAFANEPRDEILPVVSGRLDRDEAVGRFSQKRSKPPVPGGFLSKRYRPL